MTRLALYFYGGCMALALLWGALAGRPWLLLWPRSLPGALVGAAAGVGLGFLVVLLSRLLLRWSRWAGDLFDWFAGLLGPLSVRQAFLLAALSALGEEMLFRGAMQPGLGLWLTSAIFALAHFPQRLRFWPWTLSAGALGLAFGWLAERSGHLGGPILAHFVINALNLAQVGRRAAEKLPAIEATPSIENHGEATPTDDDPPPAQPDHGPAPGRGSDQGPR